MGRSTLKKHIAVALTLAGALAACIGIALIYPPAALIVGGGALIAAGLLAEVDE